MRPGMQPRHTTQQSKGHPGRPSLGHPHTPTTVQPSAPEGTEAVPQIEVTPSRNEHEHEQWQMLPRPSSHTRRHSPDQDLLRRATTAHASTYHPEGIQGHTSIRPEDVLIARPYREGRPLGAEHISARDQGMVHTTARYEDDDTALKRQATGSTVQDFAVEHGKDIAGGHELNHVTSEAEIESARRHMQSLADTAENVSDLQHHAPNIDWEEYQKSDLQPQHSQTEEPIDPDYFNWWGPVRQKFRQPLAEYLGTLVFMTIGLCGSVVRTTAEDDFGNLLSAYFAWGLGVMMGIYIAGGISGGHLNPALSILLSIFRGFPWSLCWQYVVAQMLGAITASGVVYGLYKDAIQQYAAADLGRAGPAFWTAPRQGLSNSAAFFTEFVATGILVGSILALGDDSNAPPGAGMHAFIIGLLITALCIAFSYNTGTCLNPARDFGPRLITWAAGFGTEVFTLHSWWWIWGPWVGTLSGGIMGALFYDAFIFNGGESPLNYPTGRLRGHLHLWREARGKSRTGRGRDTSRIVNKHIETIA
ncbi:aquaglyceroporin like protein, other eukaryote [Capronia epimyces CBS 606.96]|uniref:Aquaglyceroporin like protein, other eukaryote n=1 Tax=Capronia epimyces CBS 606.96 TaxID=1182542 RepID=W9YQN7_9EURO|nr:aquaglyceroporin like protein, other eukaryote [Capronia epimyces CBS 606.96]EXJ91970.1 aquaglyceroporin like protein, other eukaryote [Capronia epimyces CBS 606.96]